MRILAAKILGHRSAAEAPEDDAAKGQADAASPYLNGKRQWNDRIAGAVRERDMARLMALGGVLAALLAVGGSAYDRAQSKYIPYYIEVDKLGNTRVIGEAPNGLPTNPVLVRNAIEDWIESARLVTMDGTLQSRAVNKVYAMISKTDPSYQKINEFYNKVEANRPHERAKTELVSIEITSTLQQSPDSYQVEWTETVRDRKGLVKDKFRMKALLTIFHSPATPETTDEDLRRNPARLFVRDYSWTRIG